MVIEKRPHLQFKAKLLVSSHFLLSSNITRWRASVKYHLFLRQFDLYKGVLVDRLESRNWWSDLPYFKVLT